MVLVVSETEMVKSEKMARAIIGRRNRYFVQKLREFKRNSRWVAEEREGLRAKYPDMYIAVRNQEVFVKDKNLSALVSKVRATKNNEDIFVDYISKKRLRLLL